MTSDHPYIIAVCSEGPPPHYYVIDQRTREVVVACDKYTEARRHQDNLNGSTPRERRGDTA